MKTKARITMLLGLVFGVNLLFAQNSSPTPNEQVLLRLTSEPISSGVTDIPITLRRIDRPGPTVQLVATPGAVDAALVPAGVYELASKIPVEVNGQQLQWRMQIPVFDRITRIRLSIANAVAVDSIAPQQPVVAKQSNPPSPETTPPQAMVEVDLRIDPSIVGAQTTTPIELRRLDHPQPAISLTIANGVAKLQVPPGRYEIVTIQPLSSGSRQYFWDMEAPLTDPVNHVQLSEWQALVLGPGDSNSAPKATAQRTPQY